MLKVNNDEYEAMLGSIDVDTYAAVSCMSQCTGCMCNCRCSCSGGVISDFDWEVM
ncbi:MAG: FibroRumin family radical SAM-modified Cys-rich RiPP [Clostridiales bacterium]|nr:FibroRumin family radical SAM-modified Cys-rich RiPP [Clostridiales bacterium]MCD7835143.1 FibroRumin family radical SAM-modified Cys-rich RiPP [Lachnospiraceae bacterium]